MSIVLSKQKQRGQAYEALAESFLLHQGAKLIHRNFQTRRGEIDRIVLHNMELAFVEVRFRQHTHFGDPAETVTLSKQKKLKLAAEVFLQQNPSWQAYPCRFDVIAITANPLTLPHPIALEQIDNNGGQFANVRWLQDAFQVSSW